MNSERKFSFADPEIAASPFETYQQLQRSGRPVFHDEQTGLYEVVGAAEIRQAAEDVETFSNMMSRQQRFDEELKREVAALYASDGFPPIPTLLNNDGDSHRRFRSLVDRGFTVTRINALMPAIREEVARLLDALEGENEIEFVEKFAIPLPVAMICDQLGVSREKRDIVKRGSDALVAVADPLTPRKDMLDRVRDVIAMQQLLADRVEHAREYPDETIISAVANGEVDGERMTVGMLVNLFQNVLVAGNETTTNGLGNALQLLMADKELMAGLRDDPSKIRNFVEEALRVKAPLQGFYRIATKDTELGGVKIPKGALLMLRWGASNVDSSKHDCSEKIDLDRKAITQHTTFGHGVHFCIGNQLARGEMRASFEAITQRWPNVRLAEGKPVEPLPAFFNHGPRKLWVRID